MRRTICLVLAGVALLVLLSPTPSAARGHVSFGTSIWIGPGWWGPWWGPRPHWAAPYPYYYPAPPYYYPAPPVVVQPPPVAVQPAPPSQYWYYCRSPQGYYPYVRECPGGWTQVSPQPPPPDR